MKHEDSKDVILDPSIDSSVYTENEEPYDSEFANKHHYITSSVFIQLAKIKMATNAFSIKVLRVGLGLRVGNAVPGPEIVRHSISPISMAEAILQTYSSENNSPSSCRVH